MSHIFISYSHKDSVYVHKLAETLEKEGFVIWLDDRIHYGSEWPKVVTRNLDISDGVIVVLSNNSYESDMVQNEITRAREKKKHIFPLLLEGENWLIVQAKQFVDVKDGSFPTEKFYKRLEEISPRRKTIPPKDISPVPPRETKPEPSSSLKILGISITAIAFLALVIWGVSSLPASPKATQTPFATQTLLVETATKMPVPATSTATIIPTPTLGIGSTMIGEDGATLVYVPAGEFLMGSTDADTNAQSDEKLQHPVTLDAFWIDEAEVTNQLFSSFVSTTGYQTDAEKAGSSYVYAGSNWTQTNGADWQHPTGPSSDISGKEKYPVIHVSWNDAVAYCKWADRRLPTEAEWEKAASWNDLTQEKYIYPWGNDFNGSVVNFCDKNCTLDWADKNSDDGFADTAPVGNYPKGVSPYGAYDMAGNVWEWVSDWYGDTYYQSSPSSNPLGPDSGQYRVLRGGSWSYYFSNVRSANRYWNSPTGPTHINGFRCSRSQ